MSTIPRRRARLVRLWRIRGGVAGARAGLVLKPGGVARVMIFVLDAPAAAGRAERIVRAQRLGQDEHPAAAGGDAGGFVHAVALDFEQLGGVDEAELFRGDRQGAVMALVDAAVAEFEGSRKKGGAAPASSVSARAAAFFWLAFNCTRAIAPWSCTSGRTSAGSA